jgi:RHS repeat-associated protein
MTSRCPRKSDARHNTYSYDPWGVTTTVGTVTNPYQYAGGYTDTQTGLTKFGTRYYNPILGRWTQVDPVPDQPAYAYAGDSPVVFTDSNGLCVAGLFGSDCDNVVTRAAERANRLLACIDSVLNLVSTAGGVGIGLGTALVGAATLDPLVGLTGATEAAINYVQIPAAKQSVRDRC